jgi:hypothetical protein
VRAPVDDPARRRSADEHDKISSSQRDIEHSQKKVFDILQANA